MFVQVLIPSFHVVHSISFSLYVDQGDGTKGMIGKEQIEQMKKGVLLVNAARGGVIDEQALYEKLEDGEFSR